MRYNTAAMGTLLACLMLSPQTMAHFSGFTTPANVVGERRAWAIVDLRGASRSNVKVYVSYGTTSAGATTGGPDATYADARCAPYGTDRLKCYVVFPHYSRSSGWNPYDKNPKRIRAGQRVYFRWAKEVRISGASTAATINDTVRSFIMPRRLTLGVFGDSYASGEGAPYGSSRWMGGINQACHRSYNSGHYRGVKDFIRANPGIDVHWRFYACSGAEIYNGIFMRQVNNNGVVPDSASQFDRHKRWIEYYGYPRMDVALVGIGGNDIGFIEIGTECVLNNLRGGCNRNEQLASELTSQLRRMYYESDGQPRGRYTYLNTKLRNDLGVKKVIITEYPDLTRDANRNYCNMLPLVALRPDCAGILESTMSTDEAEWTYSDVLVRLNRKIKQAADGLNWILAGDSQISASGALGNTTGNMARSRTRGLCNCDTGYFNTVRQSFLRYGEKNAAWHPNSSGFSGTYRRSIRETLQRTIAPVSARREYLSLRIATRSLPADTPEAPVASLSQEDIVEREQGAFIDDYPGASEVATRSAKPADVDQKEDATGAAKIKKVKPLDDESDYAVADLKEPAPGKPKKPTEREIENAKKAENEVAARKRVRKKRANYDDVPAAFRDDFRAQEESKARIFEEFEKMKKTAATNGKQKPKR